jgi:hypothetical protein
MPTASAGAKPRLHVDAWDPAYGTALDADGAPTEASAAALDLDLELAAGAWTPLSPPGDVRAPDVLLFVDGVRRIDGRVWAEEGDGTLHPGLAASYAAGVVRCDLRRGRAELAAAEVARGIFTASPGVADLVAPLARYPVRRTDSDDPARLQAAVQADLHALEERVGLRAGSDAGLLVVDGPLHRGAGPAPLLGYVKTHHKQYLPAELAALVGRLAPGQRSPVFRLGTTWQRHSWYLRLPGPAAPWAGVVRLEASAELSRGEVVALADTAAVALPRFASHPFKDPRAPQNLIPIGGLERRLRGMLGDARLLLRALTIAAASA